MIIWIAARILSIVKFTQMMFDSVSVVSCVFIGLGWVGGLIDSCVEGVKEVVSLFLGFFMPTLFYWYIENILLYSFSGLLIR
jgi:hypothetical protein